MFNGFALNNIKNAYVGSTPAQAIYLGSTLIWPTTPSEHDYSKDYFTIVSLEDNNDIGWKTQDNTIKKSISVSTDNGATWLSYNPSTTGSKLATLNNGDKLLIKGNNIWYQGSGVSRIYFTSTKNFHIEGNIMSLSYGDNFYGQTSLDETVNWHFKNIFFGCTKLISAENLILPATTLAYGCYESMFDGCTSLSKAPILPATKLASSCYSGMFAGCSSLTKAPDLPATTLANSCYDGMFDGCTSLTTAPELQATTLATNCYGYMFENCTSLTTAPELPATTLANLCYRYMFYGCTSLSTAPELPATTLANQCYKYMFDGCKSLNYIKCLATDISATECTSAWLADVSSSGTFVKDASMTSWTTGSNGIPSGWTVQNA